MLSPSMRKSFKDSLKVLEADIQHANTLASEFSRDYDGACLQMRMSYSPAAHVFLFLVQWTDCSLAGALGLLRILIYKVYADGTTTMSTHERKASIREFYAVIFPSLQQLQKGITDMDDRKQKALCVEKFRRRDEDERRQLTDIDAEREDECGICMETNSKIVLPDCSHAMCMRCYRDCRRWPERGRRSNCWRRRWPEMAGERAAQQLLAAEMAEDGRREGGATTVGGGGAENERWPEKGRRTAGKRVARREVCAEPRREVCTEPRREGCDR